MDDIFEFINTLPEDFVDQFTNEDGTVNLFDLLVCYYSREKTIKK